MDPTAPIPPLEPPHESEKQKYTWLRTLSIGFAIVSIGIAIAVGGYLLTMKKQQPAQKSMQNTQQQLENADMPPLLIKHLGVNLEPYDPATGKAGDFVFTKQKLQFNRLFMGFGFVIPAEVSSNQKAKSNPQPTFVVPLGTPVRSLVDGIVAAIPILWSKDYSIQVTADGKMQRWIYETEHLINPRVKVGDRVVAGQIVGEVSNFNGGAPAGFGEVEIGILKGGQKPEHVCPFAYLDPLVKEELFAKINAFYKAWEDYTGNTSLYGEEAMPGCLTLDLIEG